MAKLPSRLRRLDEILADLPVEDPMLLSELDGYLTCVAAAPEPIAPSDWLPPIWGGLYGEDAPFEDPIDVRLFAEMVQARHAEILRDLARGKPQPIFDIDDRTGEILWEEWIAGFEMAMLLHPDGWLEIADQDDPDATAALSAMLLLVDVAKDATGLPGPEINAICEDAPSAIPRYVMELYTRRAASASPKANTPLGKVGRNDPCPCGSGKKFKKCCGAA